MAESEERAEAESGPSPSLGADLGATLALALHKGGQPRGQPDPELAAFLQEQTRLAKLQSEHLHEQRELALSRLRWGRFGDRLKALLQAMTAVVGVGVVVLGATMAWHAHRSHGLVVEAFSVPPDLARGGLTGQVAASRFLDKLRALQAATTDSDRPAQSYESNWGSDVKVEIPETGLTFGELEKLLLEKLGHLTHVTGEVMTTPTGIAVTARIGDEAPQTFTGPPGAYDDLAQQAAEAVYRASQPYRYVEYLDDKGRWDEAFRVVAELAATGPDSERGWAYSKWALMDLNDRGDLAAARVHALRGLGFTPGSDLSDRITLVNIAVWSGDEETDLGISRLLDRQAQKRLPDTSQVFFDSNKRLARAWLTFLTANYAASAAEWRGVVRDDPRSHFATLAPAMAATAEALGHDLPAARATMATAPGLDETTMVWDVAEGAFEALPSYWIPAGTGRWSTALARARAVDAALEAGKAKTPIYGPMQQVWIRPLEALALARSGDVAAAQALIDQTALDCYPCLRVRGQVAAEARDWAGAERWFALAARRAPSVPYAYAEWGRMRLDRGDPAGAITVLKLAHAKAPSFADPLETWGEALMAQGDHAGARTRFVEAARLAPHWGRLQLKWAEALARLGEHDAARAHLRQATDLTPAEQAELDRSGGLFR